MTCGITGICLLPGSHSNDGWIPIHEIESSSTRLMIGIVVIAGGFRSLGESRRP
jgi:hypothetical protein